MTARDWPIDWSESMIAGVCSASGRWTRPLRGQQAIGDVERRDDDMRRVAVQAVDRDVEVALFGFRRDAGRRAAAHHVDDNQRRLGGDGEAKRFDHQRQAGTGRRGQRGNAAETRADDHVDRGQFILRLHQHAAALLQRRGQPFEDFGRRRDRIAGDEFDAALDRAESGRLIAGDRPAVGGRLSREATLTPGRVAGSSCAAAAPCRTARSLAANASGFFLPIDSRDRRDDRRFPAARSAAPTRRARPWRRVRPGWFSPFRHGDQRDPRPGRDEKRRRRRPQPDRR